MHLLCGKRSIAAARVINDLIIQQYGIHSLADTVINRKLQFPILCCPLYEIIHETPKGKNILRINFLFKFIVLNKLTLSQICHFY